MTPVAPLDRFRSLAQPLLPLLLAVLAACAGPPSGDGSVDEAPITRGATVALAQHHDVSAPLTLLPPAPRSDTHSEHEVKPVPRQFNTAGRDPVRQASTPPLLVPVTTLSFDGVGNGFSGPAGTFTVASAPPDTNGDVGPNHYVQIVNTDFAIFNKSGAAVFGPVAINTLWSGFGGGCQTNNDGDPVVLYDPIADRWLISQFSVNTLPYLQCVAVSQTPDPTGAYNRYSFQYTNFPDYPKFGVWPDAYYVTFNMFAGGTTFSGGQVCAYDRTKMLQGLPATQQCFNLGTSFGGVLPADLDGARQPPAGSPNYVVGMGASANQLAYWKFHVDWTTPSNTTLTGPTTLATAAFSEACAGGTCIPQSGTTQRLDSLADRVMFRLAYRNFADHEAIVVNHSITSGSSTGVRWYELRADASHNLSIFQQGTYAPDTNFRWMGSIAMDQAGNMALGFSVSSSAVHPEIHYTGRLVGDPAGQMPQGEGTIINGPGSQTTNLSRWGDYSNMAVDPVDDCTFWYTTEYLPANGTFNWRTRIGTFKFPGCGGVVPNDFSISANPTALSLTQGASGTSTISTAVTSGAAQTVNLTVSGVPAGASASLNPTSVTAGGSSTLTVNTGTAAAGSYTLTVTGTGTSATHSTTVALTITAPVANDFSMSASPSSLSLAQGASATSTISTTIISGSAQTINLTVSGTPTGATASLNPTSITSGGSSTLTVGAGTAAPASYTLTITGTGTSATHTTTVALTVTSSGGSGITNGGFETGTLSGWTPSGASASVVTGGHSGTYAARVGTTTPTNGDSSIAQTFTAPSGTTGLSFYYKVVCPDTLTYDWATATLRDNTAATTVTVLPKICTNNGAWVQVTASAIAGHSYTLTLFSHDDNYSTDPTYTLYDDVTLTSTPPPPPPPSGITNGGFETGSLSGWTAGGASTSVVTGGHSGTYAARLGSTSPTNGDSSIAQTFTAPAGTTGLSFFYKITCPDTLTYDWATATLRDDTAGTTATVLARTCTNSGAWVQATAAITAGRSYTLTLISHDDNYSTDPTYTLYDDVTVQ